jgi:hypothetical protein
MAVSDVEICNRALDAIGAQVITSLTEGTRPAGLCLRYFPQVRDDVLRSHPWNCALKRSALAADATPPIFGYESRYTLPSDCLRVLRVEGDVDPLTDWQVEAGGIVTNLGAPLYILYVRRVTESGLLDPMLVSVIAARLAMELAIPLTGSQPIRQQMEREYLDRLRAARSADGQEGTALRLGADEFVLARR